MPVACSAFGTHQIVTVISFIDVRCFNPYWFLRKIDSTIDNDFIGSGNNLVVFQIVLPDFDNPVPVVQLFSGVGGIVVYYVCLTIVVEKHGRINAVELQFVRIAPPFEGIVGFHHNVSEITGKLGSNHVKRIVIGIILNGWSVNSGTYASIVHL